MQVTADDFVDEVHETLLAARARRRSDMCSKAEWAVYEHTMVLDATLVCSSGSVCASASTPLEPL